MIKGDEVKIYVIAVLIISQNAKNYSNIVSWVKYCDCIVVCLVISASIAISDSSEENIRWATQYGR